MKTLQEIASNLERNLGVSDPEAARQAVADFWAFDREIHTDYLKAMMDRAEWIERRLEGIALEADAGDVDENLFIEMEASS